jgi:hypothetical protein
VGCAKLRLKRGFQVYLELRTLFYRRLEEQVKNPSEIFVRVTRKLLPLYGQLR